MSDETRRQELKAKINDKLNKLSIEDLEKVAGGNWTFAENCPVCGGSYGFSDEDGMLYCTNCGYRP